MNARTRFIALLLVICIISLGSILLIRYADILSFINTICMCNNIWYQLGIFVLLPASVGTMLFMMVRYSMIVKKMASANQIDKVEVRKESTGFNLDRLSDGERQVCLALKRNGGVMYQKDIGVETKLPPYKVSRIITGLAGSDLIKIERDGMANKITLIKELKER